MELNEDTIIPLLVAALVIGLWARGSFKRTRNANEILNIARTRHRGAYGTGGPRKPWFGTPFFILFIIAAIVVWVVFA